MGWAGGVGLGLAAGTGEGGLRRASSCSCLSLAWRRARSSSALRRSSSSFCLAMFSKRALMLPVLLPAGHRETTEEEQVSKSPMSRGVELRRRWTLTSLHGFSLLVGRARLRHLFKRPGALAAREGRVTHTCTGTCTHTNTQTLTLSIRSFWTPNFPPNPFE